MRILILAQHLSRALGGIEIQCDLLARELAKNGHAVCYGVAGGMPSATASQTYALDTWTPGDARQTAALIARARPDVIYLRHNKTGLRTTARVAARAGVPLVFAASSLQDVQAYSYHRSHAPRTLRRLASIAWQRLKSRWNWSGFRRVSAAVSLNPDYTEYLPVARRRHIPDSMETDAVPFHWPRRFVAWVAQIKDYKNPGAYVDLARRCTDLDVDFLMIGAVVSPRYRWIEDGDGRPANFHYLGAMTPAQVNGVLAAAQALVHTCDPEGFGNNFVQAWLQGTPTMSLYFDPGGTIERERLGSVPGNLTGLERDLRDLLADANTRIGMGARAQAYARAHHDPTINTRRLVELFEDVIGRAPP